MARLGLAYNKLLLELYSSNLLNKSVQDTNVIKMFISHTLLFIYVKFLKVKKTMIQKYFWPNFSEKQYLKKKKSFLKLLQKKKKSLMGENGFMKRYDKRQIRENSKSRLTNKTAMAFTGI